MVVISEIDDPTREKIQSIKDAVGNHSEDDIFAVLKENNMDADETVHKLLFQDPYHEVKRKRVKKKENIAVKVPSEPRKVPDQNTAFKGTSETRKFIEQKQNIPVKRSSDPRREAEHTQAPVRRVIDHSQGVRPRTFSDRNVRRGGYIRNSSRGINREFRVVRDNRVNQSTYQELRTDQSLNFAGGHVNPSVTGKSPRTPNDQTLSRQKSSEGQKSSLTANGPSDLGRRPFKDTTSNSTNRRGGLEENQAKVPTASPSSQPSTTLASSNTVVGLYSSASDPVHVPSNSRSSGGAIRREVGVVGRQSSENSAKQSTAPSSSVPVTIATKNISSNSRPTPPSSTVLKSSEHVPTSVSESVASGASLGKSFISNQHGSKPHQQPMGHQKAPQSNMEWKRKSSQKSAFTGHVPIGTDAVSVLPPTDHSLDLKEDADELQEKLSRVAVSNGEHVFIPQHLRVPEADRTQLTFGSFGVECNSSRGISSGLQGLENQQEVSSGSFGSASVSSEDVNQVDLLNDQVENSGSASPTSVAASEHSSPDKKESQSPRNSESYADIGMVRSDTPSYAPAEPQQHDPSLPSYAAYDPQTGYDIPFYRPLTDESVRIQSVPSPGEALSSHVANSIPASSVSMMQQQTIPQMYPQVHVSHFPNFMPYRQFLSPVYMPPMGLPGYSGNPGYPHPSNGSSYLLMPGGSSQLAAGGLKYGASQYKPMPAGTPTGFSSYPNPTGYTLNPQGTVGAATGLDDSTRMKFKDGNLYIPNPQGEASEIWIQTPREIPGMPSASYYNIPGQAPHPAYLQSHASFNGAATVAQTHMQFPGLYHPSQQAAIANPHHMVPNMGSNVGVGVAGAAPGAQIGAYQQPQLGHLNWNTNF